MRRLDGTKQSDTRASQIALVDYNATKIIGLIFERV